MNRSPRLLASRALFILAVAFCFTPWASPGWALAIGLFLALTLGNPFPALIKKYSKPLLQSSVVLLGFGMDLKAILAAAREGFVMAALTIALTFALGMLLRRVLSLPRSTATLLSAGTAICGGSAIAAVALAIEAAQEEISVALGTIFLLNAIALYLFPPLGHWLNLSQSQFGSWAGIAIHDISSVVGAATAYGPQALQTATAVKLSRTLWIIPVALVAGLVFRRPEASQKKKAYAIPWFVGLFLIASLLGTYLPPIHALAPKLVWLAKAGMALTLLSIGASLSREALRKVGLKPVVMGVILWLVIGTVSILAIRGLHGVW